MKSECNKTLQIAGMVLVSCLIIWVILNASSDGVLPTTVTKNPTSTISNTLHTAAFSRLRDRIDTENSTSHALVGTWYLQGKPTQTITLADNGQGQWYDDRAIKWHLDGQHLIIQHPQWEASLELTTDKRTLQGTDSLSKTPITLYKK